MLPVLQRVEEHRARKRQSHLQECAMQVSDKEQIQRDPKPYFSFDI